MKRSSTTYKSRHSLSKESSILSSDNLKEVYNFNSDEENKHDLSDATIVQSTNTSINKAIPSPAPVHKSGTIEPFTDTTIDPSMNSSSSIFSSSSISSSTSTLFQPITLETLKSIQPPSKVKLNTKKSTLKGKQSSSRATLVQSHLNFGQKMVGVFKCLVCKLEYNKSDKTDTLLHSKYHASYLGGIDFHFKNTNRNQCESNKACLVITSTDSPYHQQKVRSFINPEQSKEYTSFNLNRIKN